MLLISKYQHTHYLQHYVLKRTSRVARVRSHLILTLVMQEVTSSKFFLCRLVRLCTLGERWTVIEAVKLP